MIYTVTKNDHISILTVEPGDLKAKKKLFNYRRRGWQISARENNRPENRQPNEVDKVKIKQKRLSRKIEILKGYWVNVD